MRIDQIAKYIFNGISLILVLSSCSTSKFLKNDELLLKGNKIKIIGDEKIKNKRKLNYDLTTLYKQKPNGKVLFNLFFPREWFYFSNQEPGDTSKFQQWQKRVLGETPAIYNEKLTLATVESMTYYLQYQGFYDAEVESVPEVDGRDIYLTYFIKPKTKYKVDSTFFSSEDSKLDSILEQISTQSILKKGKGLDGNNYEKEKERISRHFRNNGYAYFAPYHFGPLEADTTLHKNQANVYVKVLAPFGDSSHQQYTIGEVTIYPNYKLAAREEALKDTIIEGYLFKSPDETPFIKPKVILSAIHLKRGDLYSQENYDKTYKKLSSLGTFKFIRIKQDPDSISPNQLNIRIELHPNLKMEFGADFDFNYTNQSSTSSTTNLIGFSVSPNLRNRNLLGGAELLVTNLSAGAEINPNLNDTLFLNTIDLRLQSDLYLPKFLDYLGIWKKLNKIPTGKNKRLIPNHFYADLKDNAATRLSASYNYLLILDWYRYNLFNASYGYDLQRSNNKRYIINHIGIDYLNPETAPAFEQLLQFNPFLERSFGEQLFVSLLFRDFNYLYNSRPNKYGVSHYLGFNIEMAGAEFWLGNSIYNAFALRSETLRVGNIDFSQYLRMELDLRYFKQYTPKQSFAARFNIGLASPFGFTTDVPYVKQFYVGGPNSIRAWAPRGLGPGGYLDPLSLDQSNNTRLYQTGDLKIEFNAEYRFEIFWRLKGAIFLDGGNVWTLSHDASRCGSQFLLSDRTFQDCTEDTPPLNAAFYKQIALGSGFGFRIDFTYFIFRFDIGVKLRYPYLEVPSAGEDRRRTGYWENFSNDWGIYRMNFNLGLGYPF